MANTVRMKRSAVQGKAPVVGDLALGELAVNTYDGKLYMKKNDGSDAIVEIGAGGTTVSATAPSSPSTGDLWYDTEDARTFVWTGTEWVDAAPDSGYAVATTSDTAPANANDGDLWYRSSDGRLYIYYDDGNTSQWVDANPNLPIGAVASDTPPANANDGDLWYRTSDGRMYLYYNDGNTSQWVDANPNLPIGAVASDTAPSNPNDGDLWYRTSDARMYVYYNDGNSSQWVDTNPDTSSTAESFERSGTTVSLVNSGDTVSLGGELTVEGVARFEDYIEFAGAISTPATAASIYRPANNNLAFGTASAERLRIDGSGRVGVANTAMASLYAGGNNLVVGDGVGDEGMTIYTGNNKQGIVAFADGFTGAAEQYAGYLLYDHNSDYMAFATTGSERLRLDSSGNMGLGTNVPNDYTDYNTLTLNGTTSGVVDFESNGSLVGQVYYDGTDFRIDARGATTPLKFVTNAAEAMRLDTNGRLLVGTTTAYGSNDNIAIQKTDAGARIGLQHSTTGQVTAGEELGVLTFYSNDGDLNPSASIVAAADLDHAVGDKPGRLVFSTTADGASSVTEQMRLDSAGRLLVGTTTPGLAAGDDLTLAGSGDAGLTIRSGSSSSGSIYFSDGTAEIDQYKGLIQYTHNGDYMRFLTANNERMRVDSSGAVTISTNDLTVYGITVGRGAGAITTNTVVGASALGSNTIGTENVASGDGALFTNTSGKNNVANGHDALYSNTTGFNNNAIGRNAMYSNTTGHSNNAIGRHALYANIDGNGNVANGRDALLNSTSGSSNTACGSYALVSNTTGRQNTACGSSAMQFCTTGINNTAIGDLALYNCSTGSGNFGCAYVTSGSLGSPVFNVTTQNDRIVMGHTAMTNAYIQVAWTVVSDQRDKMNFGTVPHGLDFIKQLNPVSFQFKLNRDTEKANGPVRYGFKAQDILALEGDDNAVIIDNEDPDKLRYNGEALVPVLVNAIKEQQTIIDTQQQQINNLLARLDAAGI